MKKLLLFLLFTVLNINIASAQSGAEVRTFTGRLIVTNGIYMLVNKDVPPDEQLSINPGFVIQKNIIALQNRCQNYCSVRARVIRDLDITRQGQTWWLVKIVFLANPPNPNP